MRVLVLFSLATLGCAHGNVELHDAAGRRGFRLDQGRVEDFARVSSLCLTARDHDSDPSVLPTILAVLKRIPLLDLDCHDQAAARVEYHASYSGCTHCPPPYRGPRFGFALVWWPQRDGGGGPQAVWTDTYGGSPEEVASHFAEDLASLLIYPAKALDPEASIE
jgi:hypothetical protein